MDQGVGSMVERTDTIFLYHNKTPEKRRKYVAYRHSFVDYRSQKDDPYFTDITVGDNIIQYPGEVITQTSDMITVKSIIQHYYFYPIGSLHVL